MIEKTKIVAIDDNSFFLKAINSLLLRDDSLDVLNVYSSGVDFLTSSDFDLVDILLLDIEMSEINGFEIAKQVLNKRQDVKIIAVTMKLHQLYIDEFKEAGFKGYIYKPNAANEFKSVIEKINKGEKYFPLVED